jgi:hypothetical protein
MSLQQKNELNIDEKINKQEENLYIKINDFFNKIDFLDLDAEKKAQTAIKVKSDAI